jgi:hypothetical protein
MAVNESLQPNVNIKFKLDSGAIDVVLSEHHHYYNVYITSKTGMRFICFWNICPDIIHFIYLTYSIE